MQRHRLDLGARAHNARSVITSVSSETTLEITTIFSTVTTVVTPGPSSTRTLLSVQTDAQTVQTSESVTTSSAPSSTIFGTPSASTSRRKQASAPTSQAAVSISSPIGIIAATSASSSSRVVGSATSRIQAATTAFVKAGPLDDASTTITSPDSTSASDAPTSTSSSIPISSAGTHRHLPIGAIIAMGLVLATIGTLAFFVCRLRTRRRARRDQHARRWWSRTSRHYEDSLVDASPLPRAPNSPTYPYPPNDSSNTISVPPMAEFGARRSSEGTAFILDGARSQAGSRSSASMYSMSSQGDSFVDDIAQPSPMSVRPFSDSEAFAFPKPPLSQNGSDPSSSSRSLLKLSVPPSPNTPRPPTMVYIPPIPPLPKSPPPPVPVSLVPRNPFADPQPVLSLSPNRVPNFNSSVGV